MYLFYWRKFIIKLLRTNNFSFILNLSFYYRLYYHKMSRLTISIYNTNQLTSKIIFINIVNSRKIPAPSVCIKSVKFMLKFLISNTVIMLSIVTSRRQRLRGSIPRGWLKLLLTLLKIQITRCAVFLYLSAV
jgi:hypothetical protein